MLPVVSAEKSKVIDRAVMEQFRLSTGELMMENAARSCLEIILKIYGSKLGNCLVLCGVGNNGGDGFALARLLSEYAFVQIYVVGDISKMSPETKLNYELAKNNNKNIDIIHILELSDIDRLSFDYDFIIDALIGVGGDENLRGLVVPILQKANATIAKKIAIDVPTGVNTTTGRYHPDAFKANVTITMFAKKRAMLEKKLRHLFGDVYVAYLGFDSRYVTDLINEWEIEARDFKLLRDIAIDANKYDCGKIAILAGSERYPGAAAIASNAAVEAGAGLVHLFSTCFHSQLRFEVIQHKLAKNIDGYIESSNYDYLVDALNEYDVIAIGPGIGNNIETLDLIKKLLAKLDKKIILDADALRIVNKFSELNKKIVLTPHLGEFARILGIDKSEILSNRYEFALSYSQKMNTNLLLKGSTTIITNGKHMYYSTSGNQGLASGGTGDALTGIIAAFAARTDDLAIAAAIGAYIHGLAAEIYAQNHSLESTTAMSIIKHIGKAIRIVQDAI